MSEIHLGVNRQLSMEHFLKLQQISQFNVCKALITSQIPFLPRGPFQLHERPSIDKFCIRYLQSVQRTAQ